MNHSISIIYAWLVRTTMFFIPDSPFFMRIRGAAYSLGMKKCGKNLQVSSSAYFNSLSDLKIGSNVYIAHNTVIIGKDITIGDNVLIGPNCVISGGNHQFSNESFRFSDSTVEPVTIHDGSWISANCTITGGAVLPSKSILAAGAVLTKKHTHEKAVYKGIPAIFSHFHID